MLMRLTRMRLLLLLTPALVWAQSNVIISSLPPQDAVTTIIHYTAGVADYTCKALSSQSTSTIAVTTVSNANPGIMTATAHGLYFATGVTQVALVFISGATGGWATLNGFHLVTPTSANALSINVDTSGFGAWGAQSIVMSTRVPKATASVWSVSPIVSDAGGNPTIIAWTVPVPSSGTLSNLVGGQTSMKFPCAAPSSYQ